MKIETGEIITLDNKKEYICVSRKDYQGSSYLYLISNFKPLEVRFAKEIIINSETRIEIVNEKGLKVQLLELFQKELQDQTDVI